MSKKEMKKKQLDEAMKRLKMLKVHPNVLNEFERGVLNYSERGILYWATNEMKNIISEFEEEYDSIVYHVIHSNTEYGELLTLLYVSDSEEEWEFDRNDLKENYAIAYVKNLDIEEFSEFGGVGIMPLLGGVIRTA